MVAAGSFAGECVQELEEQAACGGILLRRMQRVVAIPGKGGVGDVDRRGRN